MVEPVNPLERGDFHRLTGFPGASGVNQFRFVEYAETKKCTGQEPPLTLALECLDRNRSVEQEDGFASGSDHDTAR